MMAERDPSLKRTRNETRREKRKGVCLHVFRPRVPENGYDDDRVVETQWVAEIAGNLIECTSAREGENERYEHRCHQQERKVGDHQKFLTALQNLSRYVAAIGRGAISLICHI